MVRPFIDVNSKQAKKLTSEIEKHYNDFLEHNITEMCKFMTPMWIHPKDIYFDTQTITAYNDLISEEKKLVCNDPFVKSEYAGEFNIGRDILKRGTFWFFVLNTINGKLCVKEGKHRMASIKLLVHSGEWPKDKKLFCLICDEGKSVFNKKQRFSTDVNIMRFRWYGELLNDLHYTVDFLKTDRPVRAWRIIGGACGNFRNFFWQTKMMINPSEKVNNYEKYKGYWEKHNSKYKIN